MSGIFSDRAPAGGGPVQNFDMTQPADYPRPYRSSLGGAAVQMHGIRDTDITHRMAYVSFEHAMQLQTVVDVRVVYDGELERRMKATGDLARARREALECACLYVDKIVETGMTRAAGPAEQQLRSLQREIEMNRTDQMKLATGSLGPMQGQKTPGGVQMTPLGSAPHSRIPQLHEAGSPEASAVETFKFRSHDGRELEFEKKRGGRFVPDLIGTINLLCLREAQIGGDWTAPLRASNLILEDVHGQVVVLVGEQGEPPPIDLAPGFRDGGE